MSFDSDELRQIRLEVARQINIILSGTSANASTFKEDINELFPGMATISERPVMQPYGLSSAAVDGLISVVARQGDHRANCVVLGHRDKDKPSVEKGEVILYDASGHRIELKTSSMFIGTDEVELLDQLIKLLTTIINARVNTIFGPQPLIPNPLGVTNGETFTTIKTKLQTLKGS